MTATLITNEQQAIITNLLRFAAAIGEKYFDNSCCDIDAVWLQDLMSELAITRTELADENNPSHQSIMADWDMMNGDPIHVLNTNKFAELLAPLLISVQKPTQQKEESNV